MQSLTGSSTTGVLLKCVEVDVAVVIFRRFYHQLCYCFCQAMDLLVASAYNYIIDSLNLEEFN